MDEIRVKNLEVFCHHGVYKEENVLGQYCFKSRHKGCRKDR